MNPDLPVEIQRRQNAVCAVPTIHTHQRDGVNLLCYKGSWDALRALESLPGSFYDCHGLWLPSTRLVVLLVETIGKLEASSEEYRRLRKLILAPSAGKARYPATPLGQPEPLLHQQEAFLFARSAFFRGYRGFANWSECGTGKTRWAIDVARSLAPHRVLVVSQKSTIEQWCDEAAALWLRADLMPLTGSLEERIRAIVRTDPPVYGTARVMVTNWEALWALRSALVKWKPDVAIFDESSRAKNQMSQMSRAARQIAVRSNYRLCLSGTPVGNDPGDLWAQYDILQPGLFPRKRRDYVREYFQLGGVMGTEFVGFQPEHLSSFVEKLYTISYRVTKATVMDMPEKTRRVQRLTMSEEQAVVYRSVAEKLFAEIETENGERARLNVAHAMSRVLRLQQLAAGIMPHNLRISEDGKEESLPPGHYSLLRSAKTEWLCQFVTEQLYAEDNRLIIWTRFLPEVREIGSRLQLVARLQGDEFGVIDGTVASGRREQLRREFNDRSSPRRVLICQIQAAAYGLDLPSADVLIYHSQSFSYTDRRQSEDRGHRVGRVRPYQIIDLVLRDTVDELCLQAIRRKQSVSDLLLSEGTGALRFKEEES